MPARLNADGKPVKPFRLDVRKGDPDWAINAAACHKTIQSMLDSNGLQPHLKVSGNRLALDIRRSISFLRHTERIAPKPQEDAG